MWVSNTQQFMRTDVVYQTEVRGEKKTEVLRPEDMVGIFGVKVDDGSFEPISQDQKKKDFLDYKDFVMGLQAASVEQAARTQDPNQALNIDFAYFLQRGSEHFNENSTHILADKNAILPQQPSAPVAVTPPTDPNAPAPEATQPLSPEDAGAVSPDGTQADGKSLPNTFPVRNVNNAVM